MKQIGEDIRPRPPVVSDPRTSFWSVLGLSVAILLGVALFLWHWKAGLLYLVVWFLLGLVVTLSLDKLVGGDV